MKFKVFDRVKIVMVRDEGTIWDVDPNYLIDKKGIIVSIQEDQYLATGEIDCPYEIKFDDPKVQESDNVFWEEDELELVETVIHFTNGSKIETVESKNISRGQGSFVGVDIDQVIKLYNLAEAFKNLGIEIQYTDGTFREFGCVMLDLQKIWGELEKLD